MRLILIKGVAIHLISKDEDFNTYKWATCRKEVTKMKSQLSIIPSDWMFSFHMFWYAHPALVKLWQKLFYVNKLVIDNWDTWFSPWLIAIVCKYKNNFMSVNKQQTTTSCINQTVSWQNIVLLSIFSLMNSCQILGRYIKRVFYTTQGFWHGLDKSDISSHCTCVQAT